MLICDFCDKESMIHTDGIKVCNEKECIKKAIKKLEKKQKGREIFSYHYNCTDKSLDLLHFELNCIREAEDMERAK